MQDPLTEELHIETQHYNFTVYVTNRYYNNIHISKHYLVGLEEKPCLSLSFYTPDSISIFSKDIVSTANLNNIESLRECIDNEIRDETMRSHSFGNELIQWVYTHLRDTYPYIKQIKLDDESYIPCNRIGNDTLDLITYSIAHYKNTWYEKNYKAYLLPESTHKKYRDSVEKYSSKEFKDSITWERFYMLHFQSSTQFAYNTVSSHIDKYKTLYESSLTFPDFFKGLTESLEYADKCKFYKAWLQNFINSVVPISRRWYIPIEQVGGNKKNSNRTKKRYRVKNSKIE